jgi:hypothetical protein
MGNILKPFPVKLILGMLAAREEDFLRAEELFCLEYGPVDFSSSAIPFTWTEYYREEMGGNLLRKFVSAERLIDPSRLPGIKHFSNSLERRLAGEDGRRVVNLDPGYLTEGKLVLASTKDHQHRLYLCEGIFAEVTLRFVRGRYRPWDWTYPDYRSEEYASIFQEIRDLYRQQLKRLKAEEGQPPTAPWKGPSSVHGD